MPLVIWRRNEIDRRFTRIWSRGVRTKFVSVSSAMADCCHCRQPLRAATVVVGLHCCTAVSLVSLIRADVRGFGGLGRALSTVGFFVVLSYRVSHRLFRGGLDTPALIIQLLAQLVFGCEISRKATIGPSLVIVHPAGVLIGPHCRICKGCTLGIGAFIGCNTNSADPADYPTLEDKVSIAPGARIMGSLVVGKSARIGPNVVVLSNVPANCSVLPAAPRVMSHWERAG
jgi:serine acetyltransferase